MPSNKMIEMSNITFSWPKESAPTLLIGNLFIRKGEKVLVEGPSGSGKSTLLSLIAGVNTPQKGTIRVNGSQLHEMKGAARDRFRADHIGLIYQMFNLIPYLSVMENVTLPCRFSKRKNDRVIKRSSELKTEANRLLGRLGMNGTNLVNKPVTELSVGQQQRVAAARALIGSPEILIADEPTSALDTDHRKDFIRLIFSECRNMGATLIFVSHDKSLSHLFDRTIRLNEINRLNPSLNE